MYLRFTLVLLLLSAACSPGEVRSANVLGKMSLDAPTAGEPGPLLLCRRQRSLPAKPEWVASGDLDRDGYEELLVTTLVPGSLHVYPGREQGISRDRIDIELGGYPLRPLLVSGAPGSRPAVAVACRATNVLYWLSPFARAGEQVLAQVPLPDTPRALACGDLGGDGVVEVVVATDGPQLVIHDRDGQRQVVPLTATLPRCLLVGDEQCLFVGSQAERRVDRFLWRDGALVPEPVSFPLAGMPRAMAQDDVDGDGDLELLVAGGAGQLWVLGMGRDGGLTGLDPALDAMGGDNLVTWDQYPVPIDLSVRAPAPSTDNELLVLSYASMTYSRLWEFQRTSPTGSHGGYAGQTPTSAVLTHLDGDGVLDMAVANRDSYALSLLRGQDVHAFHSPRRIPVGGFPNALAQGDLNEDGHPDVIVINSKDDDASVLLSTGTDLKRAGRVSVGRGPHAPKLVDLDGDGHLDLALLRVDATGCRFVRLFGDGAGGFTADENAGPETVGRGNGDWTLADLDADGRQELLVLSPEGQSLVVYAPPGRAALVTLATQTFPRGPAALTTFQWDHDPTPEVALALAGADFQGLLVGEFEGYGTEAGLHWVEREEVSLSMFPQTLVAADLDGNGRDDLLVLGLLRAGSIEGRLVPVMQFESGGRQHLVHWMNLPTSAMPRDVDVADLDGDGLPEVLVCAQYAHVVDLWHGGRNPRRTYALHRLDGIGTGVGAMAAEALDLDGDGRLDLVVADGHADQVSLVSNQTPSAR